MSVKKKKKRHVMNVTPELQGVKMAVLTKLVSVQVIAFMSHLSGSS